jgi:phthiocerol/phenolphthiocerol synthesis type-I polyketide synthase D
MTVENPADRYERLLQQALVRVREVEAELASGRRATVREPIAVVGAACRLPGGINHPDDLLPALEDGLDAIVEIPPERWSLDDVWDPDPETPGRTIARWGAFIDDVDAFDPAFFGITPREARRMDPQHRLLLELTWHGLEDAGVPAADLAGQRVATVVGVGSVDYFQLSTADRERIDAHTSAGTSPAAAAGRVAFTLGLQGPAMSLDTACSSSLVAVHTAARMLTTDECDMALASGVHLSLTPMMRLLEARLRVHSPRGRIRPFDAGADGIVGGEGGGLVVLQRLSDALADGRRIRALIPGSAVNHDGHSSGMTVPNPLAQRAVLREALRRAGLSPGDVGYVEAHGTGTPLGDPIEAESLGSVYGASRTADNPLPIGSIKSNIGHLGAAAGIAGLIKVMGALEAGRIPPQRFGTDPTPEVDWARAHLRIATSAGDWAGEPRIAGVSSFGFSGTNAHVLVQQAPAPAAPQVAPRRELPLLLPLSARSDAALAALGQRLAEAVTAADAPDLGDTAHTLAAGRSHLSHRAAVVATTALEASEALRRPSASLASAMPPDVAFLFPGQGNQYGGMAAGLLRDEPVFAAAIAEVDALIEGRSTRTMTDLLSAQDGDPDLHLTSLGQPMLVALSHGLQALWASWGIRPRWVLGHSLGEISAALVSGALTLPDALTLAIARGRLMEALPRDGGMALVTGPRTAVEQALTRHPDVSVSAYNGPDRLVLSARSADLAPVLEELAADGLSVRPLTQDRAYHTAAMSPIVAEFRAIASTLSPRPPTVPMISTLTGAALTVAPGPQHWVDEALQPVRFQQAMDSLVAEGCEVFLELGPGPSLVSMADWLPATATRVISLKRDVDNRRQMLHNLAVLHGLGASLDWPAVNGGGHVVSLPGYPFQRERHWIDEPRRSAGRGHPLLGEVRESVLAGDGQRVFAQTISATQPAYLADHRVGAEVVMPAAGYVEMAFAAVGEHFADDPVRLSDLVLERMLPLGPDDVELQTLVTRTPDGFEVSIHSRVGNAWQRHCRGVLQRADGAAPEPVSWTDAAVLDDDHLARAAASGVTLGHAFQATESLAVTADGAGVAHVRLPSGVASTGYRLHPVLLDGCLQAASVHLPAPDPLTVYVPTQIDAVESWATAPPVLVCHATLRERTPDSVVVDASVQTPDHQVIARVEGLRLRAVPRAAVEPTPDDGVYAVGWQRASTEATVPSVNGGGPVVIITDDAVAGEQLVEALARCDRPARVVTDPSDAVSGATTVVHLLCCGIGTEVPPADLAAAVRSAVEPALSTVQSLLARQDGPVPLWLVTTGARKVVAEDALPGIAQAPVWGLGQVAGREHPELAVRLVDLDPEAVGQSLEVLAGLIQAGTTDLEDRVALRAGQRHLERVVPLTTSATQPSVADPDGVYVVTGGLSGLGLETAEWLVGRGCLALCLIGRRAPADEAASRIRALRDRGVDVVVALADVAQEDQLDAALQKARATGRPVRGVYHSAGVVRDGTVGRLEWADVEAVFRAKIEGSWALHRLTAADPVVEFVVFSSAVTLLGAVGQASHTGANLFLDSLAHHRRAHGLAALAVDWGAWGEVGEAAGRADAAELMAERGMGMLTASQAFGTLQRLLAAGVAQAAVLPIDWPTYLARSGDAPMYEIVAAATRPLADVGATGSLFARLSELTVAQRYPALQQHVHDHVARIMGLPEGQAIARSARFVDLGVDSLMALEIRNALVDSIGRPLRATLLFDFPTMGDLTGHIGADVLQLWPRDLTPDVPPPAEQPDDLEALDRDALNSLIDAELDAWKPRSSS